jgi:hypothetical protein
LAVPKGVRAAQALHRAVEIACMYLPQNATQEFLGDLRAISQPTVSRIVTTLVPVVKAVLEGFVPDAKCYHACPHSASTCQG